MAEEGSALGEGFYFMGEKFAWGYEGVEKDAAEAFRMYQQAASLGSSKARVRIGQLQEHGKGTACDPRAALRNYLAAARQGNSIGLACAALLLSRSTHLEKAEALWSRFFATLPRMPDEHFIAMSRGELLYAYVATRLRLGLEPSYAEVLHQHRLEIVSHHQNMLEHAHEEQLDRLDAVAEWMKLNLGPWPI